MDTKITIRLKYPAFIFTKNDPMVYVFYNDHDFRVTTSEYITRVWSLRERLLRLETAKLVTIGYILHAATFRAIRVPSLQS